MSAHLIDVGQIIDLACGTPETGVINFNALHTLLHIFMQQLNMQTVRLDLSDGFATLGNQAAAAPARQRFDIATYAVQPDDDGTLARRELIERSGEAAVNTVLVVRRIDGTSGGGVGGAAAAHRPAVHQQHQQHQQEQRQPQPQQQQLLPTPSASPSPAPPSAVASVAPSVAPYPQQPIAVPAQADFRDMQSDVRTIRDHVGGILPDSRELVNGLGQPQSAVNDMWDMLNVTKRLDAAEITIQKLIAMLNDMGKEYNKISSQLELTTRGDDITNIKDQLDTIEQRIHQSGSLHSLHVTPSPAMVTVVHHAPPPVAHRGSAAAAAVAASSAGVGIAAIESSSRYLTQGVRTARVSPAELADFDREEFVQLKSDLDYIKMAVQRIALCSGQKDIAAYLIKDVRQGRCPTVAVDEIGGGIDDGTNGNDDGDRAALSEELANRMRSLDKRTEMIERRLMTVDKRLYDVEKEFGETGERIEDVMKQMESKAAQDHDTNALYAQLNDMKSKTMQNFQSIGMLMMTRDTLTTITDDLVTRLTALDRAKIDREEADELLAEKADYNMVQRKVSNDHFDATKRELGNGLGAALAQVAELKQRVQTELAALRDLLEERTSRGDLERLREMLMGKLTAMQDRMRALSVAKREPEAAGTKTKFLRDVQCLSCEQKVVMRREEGATVARAEPMVGFKSMKPQLTFELDAVRREMRLGGNGRNMHHFEKMYKGAAAASCVDKAHLCARYCGGSHTAIAAQEAVAKRNLPRAKDAQRQVENLVKGKDGAFYRGAPFEECNCAEGVAPPLPAGMKMEAASPAAAQQPQPQQLQQTPTMPQQPPPTPVVKKEPSLTVVMSTASLAAGVPLGLATAAGSARGSVAGSVLLDTLAAAEMAPEGSLGVASVNRLSMEVSDVGMAPSPMNEAVPEMATISRGVSVETPIESANVMMLDGEPKLSQETNLESVGE